MFFFNTNNASGMLVQGLKKSLLFMLCLHYLFYQAQEIYTIIFNISTNFYSQRLNSFTLLRIFSFCAVNMFPFICCIITDYINSQNNIYFKISSAIKFTALLTTLAFCAIFSNRTGLSNKSFNVAVNHFAVNLLCSMAKPPPFFAKLSAFAA